LRFARLSYRAEEFTRTTADSPDQPLSYTTIFQAGRLKKQSRRCLTNWMFGIFGVRRLGAALLCTHFPAASESSPLVTAPLGGPCRSSLRSPPDAPCRQCFESGVSVNCGARICLSLRCPGRPIVACQIAAEHSEHAISGRD